MWKKNKTVALGVGKENNGSISNISNSFLPSLGWEEAKGTFWVLCCSWCFWRPGLQAFHGIQKTLPLANDLQKTSLCTWKHLFQITSKTSCSTALQLWVFCSSPQYPVRGLSNTFGKWHRWWCAGFTPLTENCPKHLRQTILRRAMLWEQLKNYIKKSLHSACSLSREWNRKYISTHKKSW